MILLGKVCRILFQASLVHLIQEGVRLKEKVNFGVPAKAILRGRNKTFRRAS